MSTSELTRADTDAMARLPDGWFRVDAVPFIVKRPRWRCDRLVSLGLLDGRTLRDFAGVYGYDVEYRKKSQ